MCGLSLPALSLRLGGGDGANRSYAPIASYFLDSFAAFLGDSFLGFLVSFFWLLLPLPMIFSWCSTALCGRLHGSPLRSDLVRQPYQQGRDVLSSITQPRLGS